MNNFNLTGKVALITGGGRGLGRAMARGFADAGADIVVASRTQEELEAVAQEIRTATGRKVKAVVADLSQKEECLRLAGEGIGEFGRVDILVNNAGTNVPELLTDLHDENFDVVTNIHVTAARTLAKALVPGMKERKWGRIINISSIMAFTPLPARSAYASSKAALVALAKVWAVELGSFGITANAIAPGPFLTELPKRVLTDDQKKMFREHTAVGRFGDPEEIVGPALLLASDAGSYISGECLMVDGGYSAK